MPRTHPTTPTTATSVARTVIASLDHDPELYVPGTLTALPGSRTVTWRTACSAQCPHDDRRCHRSHAIWVDDDSTHALLAEQPDRAVVDAAAGAETDALADRHVHVPAQRHAAGGR